MHAPYLKRQMPHWHHMHSSLPLGQSEVRIQRSIIKTLKDAQLLSSDTNLATNGLADCCEKVKQKYCKISNIKYTKSQNLNVSHLGLQLSLRNILKPSVKWRIKM